MASELTVQTLKAPTSGGNANKILLGSGQKLISPGSVINVVGTVHTAGTTTTSSNFATLFSQTITPTFASSKIFIVISIGGLYMNLSAQANQSHWRIGRSIGGASDDTPVNHNTNFHTEIGRNLTSAGTRANVDMTTLDSPNTISAVEYKVQCKIFTGSNGIKINDTAGTSTMTLMEIAQ